MMVNLIKLDFYFLFCLIFCSYNLFILINNGRKSVYKTNENKMNQVHLSLCFDLEPTEYNCSEVDSSFHYACNTLFNLSNLFNANSKSPKDILDLATDLKIDEFFIFKDLKNVTSANYLNFGSICTAYTIEVSNENNAFNYIKLKIVNRFKMNSKIIFHDLHPFPIVTRIYHFECTQFSKCSG